MANASKQSHELGATVYFLIYHRGRLIRVKNGYEPVTVWTCNHAHRNHDAAYKCAVAERGRRERNS